ncbi:hypothetical protein AVEN_227802-1 [Araneus ventricosus]|uniref:Pre-C2HC domain-containing protein n=1 Tax=Araneus ventricosus TaxID=182803 RepID=A0A4Y2QV09_ARAVE|nr:hypothetical protein AVEN_227802-1 [Araneus ventricosus]
MKRRDCQDMIELLEDELLRIGSCPKSRCLVHQTERQVRSTRSDEDNFKTVSPKKAAQIRKTSESPGIQLNNKYESIVEIDKPETNEKVTPNSIPAINLLMDPNYNLTLQEIARKFPQTVNKLIKGYISITADSEESRNNILKYLKENDKEYILSERQEDRPLKIVIKNLPITQSTDLIKQDLESKTSKSLELVSSRTLKLKPRTQFS